MQTRNSGADLLRIVSMLMILTSHFFVHGGVLSALSWRQPNYYLCWFLEACCYVMVNCFALITGYFQCRTTFKLKRLLLLWGQIVAISAGAYLILAAVGKITFSWSAFFLAATPVTGSRYWFATAYVFLYALSPLFNFAIHRMNRRQHFLCCAVLCGIFVLTRNLRYWVDFANLSGGYSYTSLAVLYMLGAYFALYPPKKRPWLLWYFVLSAVTAASRIGLSILRSIYGFDSVYLKVLLQYNSVTVVAASACLFLFFVSLSIRSKFAVGCIRFFAPATFGVYLIHEQIEVKALLWPWIQPSQWAQSPKLFLMLPAVTLAIFLCCALIDRLRGLLSKVLRLPDGFGWLAERLNRLGVRFLDRFAGDS